MPVVRDMAVAVARGLPTSWKKWIHNQVGLDTALRNAMGWALGSGDETIPDGPMSGLKLALSRHISHAHLGGAYERETQEAIAKYQPAGSVCYDLGASIGYLSILMGRKAKHVYAFEPSPEAQRELRRNVAANGFGERVTLVPNPVSDRVETVTFAITDTAYGSTIANERTKWPTISVESTTLDRFAAANPAPDFLKIDVEGFEGHVLDGGQETLAKKKPIICCELHSVTAAERVLKALDPHGYRVIRLDGQPYKIEHSITPGEVQVMCLPK
jgi:FkbM family methyltransferase